MDDQQVEAQGSRKYPAAYCLAVILLVAAVFGSTFKFGGTNPGLAPATTASLGPQVFASTASWSVRHQTAWWHRQHLCQFETSPRPVNELQVGQQRRLTTVFLFGKLTESNELGISEDVSISGSPFPAGVWSREALPRGRTEEGE